MFQSFPPPHSNLTSLSTSSLHTPIPLLLPFTPPPTPQESELERLTSARTAELKYLGEQNDLEITKAKELSSIETDKFKNMVDSIGAETLASIATAGPDMQVCCVCVCMCDVCG